MQRCNVATTYACMCCTYADSPTYGLVRRLDTGDLRLLVLCCALSPTTREFGPVPSRPTRACQSYQSLGALGSTSRLEGGGSSGSRSLARVQSYQRASTAFRGRRSSSAVALRARERAPRANDGERQRSASRSNLRETATLPLRRRANRCARDCGQGGGRGEGELDGGECSAPGGTHTLARCCVARRSRSTCLSKNCFSVAVATLGRAVAWDLATSCPSSAEILGVVGRGFAPTRCI